MRNQILLWGAGSQARLVERILTRQDRGDVRVIFDPRRERVEFDSEAKFVDDAKRLCQEFSALTHYVVCVGGEAGAARVAIAETLTGFGLIPLSVVHEEAYVDTSAIVGPGAQILTRAVANSFVALGADVILNTAAIVDHECQIGRGVHVMGGASVAGRVEIQDYATVGTNATVLPSLVIGEGAIVGAGAVVTKNVAPYDVVVGNPARVVRQSEPQILREPLEILNQLR